MRPEDEAEYYSDHTEYFGGRFLSRSQIIETIRRERIKQPFRSYKALKYHSFQKIDRYTFSYVCLTMVDKGKKRKTRSERIKVSFEGVRPYVISVRY